MPWFLEFTEILVYLCPVLVLGSCSLLYLDQESNFFPLVLVDASASVVPSTAGH